VVWAVSVSVLFNEPKLLKSALIDHQALERARFSALQRAEIAEMRRWRSPLRIGSTVSVLFNEPKLLKSNKRHFRTNKATSFSALQRAEIAEMNPARIHRVGQIEFQCSSTSRNC